jgi:hypothetical protein
MVSIRSPGIVKLKFCFFHPTDVCKAHLQTCSVVLIDYLHQLFQRFSVSSYVIGVGLRDFIARHTATLLGIVSM